MQSTQTSSSSYPGLDLFSQGLQSHSKGIRYENDRVGFVEHVGSQLHRRKIVPDQWQQDVLASESRYKILNTSRQVGKSTVLAGLALHKARFTADSLVLIFAPTERQAKEVFAKVVRFYLAFTGSLGQRALLKRVGITSAAVRQLGIQLENASRIEALAATDNSSRGYSADLIIIDEAAFARNSFYDSIVPSLAVTRGELVLASTPFGKRGFFYDEWMNGEEFDRFEVTAYECPRMSREFLDNERRRRGDRHFRQEYMASFEEIEDAVFTTDLIDEAMSDDVAPLWPE